MRPQTQRRAIVFAMFLVLLLAGGWLAQELVQAAKTPTTPNEGDYAKGVVLTALSGALGSVLTLLGLIVKGLVDNLTEGRDSESPRGNHQPRRQAGDNQRG